MMKKAMPVILFVLVLAGCLNSYPQVERLDASYEDTIMFANGNTLIGIDPESRQEKIRLTFEQPVRLGGVTEDGKIFCLTTETRNNGTFPVLCLIDGKGKIIRKVDTEFEVHRMKLIPGGIIISFLYPTSSADGTRSVISMYDKETLEHRILTSSKVSLFLQNQGQIYNRDHIILALAEENPDGNYDRQLILMNPEGQQAETDTSLFPSETGELYTSLISRHKMILIGQDSHILEIRNIDGGRLIAVYPLDDIFPEIDFTDANENWQFRIAEAGKATVIFLTSGSGTSKQGMLVLNSITLEPIATIPYTSLEDLHDYRVIGSYDEELWLANEGSVIILNTVTGQVAGRHHY